MKNKIGSFLLSVLIAFGLWLYVINVESPGSVETIHDIPVTMVGESYLNERNLMITSDTNFTVDLTLSGNRTDLNQVNAANITLKVDLTKLYEPGKHKVEYSISYPGTVASNAFVIEEKSPDYITVMVETRVVNNPIPVEIQWVGERSPDHVYDLDNKLLDHPEIAITGPKSVADQIAKAVIRVDLTNRTESFIESYRYTLCDVEGNPVDAQSITVDYDEVQLELKIQRIKEVELYLDVIYGAGANEKNTSVDISPKTIRVSGSDAALAALGDRIKLGSIDFSTIDEPFDDVYSIPLPDNITNVTGTTEAEVSVSFPGLATKEFAVERIRKMNVPEGMEAEIITEKVTVKVRGSSSLINKLTAEDITIQVDLSGAVPGTGTYKGAVVFGEEYEAVGAMGTYSVTVTVTETET